MKLNTVPPSKIRLLLSIYLALKLSKCESEGIKAKKKDENGSFQVRPNMSKRVHYL